jgi:hypothetical protein
MLKRVLIGAVILGGLWSAEAARAGALPAADDALLTQIFQAPPPAAPPALSPLEGARPASSCATFKWDRACSGTSEQECQTSCGSCTMCLDVIQFNPCVYECSCTC